MAPTPTRPRRGRQLISASGLVLSRRTVVRRRGFTRRPASRSWADPCGPPAGTRERRAVSDGGVEGSGAGPRPWRRPARARSCDQRSGMCRVPRTRLAPFCISFGEVGRHLMAPTVRFLVRDRACVHAWVRHGDGPWVHRWRRGRSLWSAPRADTGRRPGQGDLSADYGTTGVTDDLGAASPRSAATGRRGIAERRGERPRSKPRDLDGGDLRTRRAG